MHDAMTYISDKILIFSLFVGCFYHKGPALRDKSDDPFL